MVITGVARSGDDSASVSSNMITDKAFAEERESPWPQIIGVVRGIHNDRDVSLSVAFQTY